MGKKRKVATGTTKSETIFGFEPKEGKMRTITSYEDIRDSEDKFHLNRDKAIKDEEPDAKRRRNWAEEEADLEPSDEEVLSYADSEEEDCPSPTRKNSNLEDVSDEEPQGEEEEDAKGWGDSKRDYYNNDPVETEADALEEEAEAMRLQKKKLQKMTPADFGFDQNEWLDDGNDEDKGDTVTEVLKDVEITADMGVKERLQLLVMRYPEFEFFADELLELQPVYEDLQAEVEAESSTSRGSRSDKTIKFRALAAYISTLSMYFAIISSPANGSAREGKALDPTELRDHPVMDSILACRKLWLKVKKIKTLQPGVTLLKDELFDDISEEAELDTPLRPTKKSRKELRHVAESEAISAQRAKRIIAAEEELQELAILLPRGARSNEKTALSQVPTVTCSDESDFGEEILMNAKSAAEKAQKKRSLRFYTSQIAQKTIKRMDAGRHAGGDEDLPYRERLRDRQARLNAEAENRGKKLDEYGRGNVGLGGEEEGEGDSESDSNNNHVAAHERGEGEEYYDFVAQTAKAKREDRATKRQATAQAEAQGRLIRVSEGEVEDDGKRAIGYVIEKNKGLAPKRKKEVRNPRVKKRKKFEEKKMKLASTRAVYRGGEDRGGYAGEKTGIKIGLVKSIKF